MSGKINDESVSMAFIMKLIFIDFCLPITFMVSNPLLNVSSTTILIFKNIVAITATAELYDQKRRIHQSGKTEVIIVNQIT